MLKNIKIKIDQDDKALTPVGDNKSLGDAGTSIGNSGEDEDETANLPYKCIGELYFIEVMWTKWATLALPGIIFEMKS